MDVFFYGWLVFGLLGMGLVAWKLKRHKLMVITVYAVLWLAIGAHFNVIR